MKLKNKWLLYTIGILTTFIVVRILGSVFEYKTFFNKIEITGNEVDNNYNNYISGGKLCRIGDKLYFNYERNEWHYGLIEISSKGSKRLYWNGPTILLSAWFYHAKFLKATPYN